MEAASRPAPSYGWYGDDFTGATDTLATLAEGGQRALLFLGLPTQRQLEEAGPLDAVGIAGATRAMSPAQMTAELDAAGRFFAQLGVRLLHYKCCSTFDSSPSTGSIGAAIRALGPHAAPGPVPIVGGQPNLGRYCLFGNLFAAAGSGGAIHRIDRHPTMSIHPVTPMREADLSRHLSEQGLARVGLVDYRAYGGDLDSAWTANAEAEAVLFDVACPEDLVAIGRLLSRARASAPVLAVGASSVAQAFVANVFPGEARNASAPAPAAPVHDRGPVLALVGSLSPVTRGQVEAASSYARIAVDPARLIGDGGFRDMLVEDAAGRLSQGDVMLITDRPGGAPGNPAEVAAATAALLREIMARTKPSRLVVAGGDTSSRAIQSLDIWGLSYRAACVPGAPLCRAHSAVPGFDGLDIILKGGQIGPPDFFTAAARP